MTVFWIVTAAMVLAALAMLAPALLRTRSTAGIDRDKQNVVIARERLAELRQERDRGVLSEAQYEKSKSELEQSLLIDLEQSEESQGTAGKGGRSSGWLSVAVMVILLPGMTLGLYNHLGSPELIDPPKSPLAHGGEEPGQLPSVEEMLATLVKRLEEQPADPDGWFLLGRTYMAMEEYAKAAGAYQRVQELIGDQPVILLARADALAMSQQGDLSGVPTALVRKAVGLEPDNTTALWLAGMAEMQAGNAELAIAHWERLEPLIQDDPDARERVSTLLSQARTQAGKRSAATAEAAAVDAPAQTQDVGSGQISVRVTLSSEFLDRVQPEERVFVFARALQGPKMPLAAARLRASDLPVELILDDSSAMMPAMKISGFDQVVVGARVSRSGDPIAKSGDLTGEVYPVTVGEPETVVVTIDTVVP